MNHRNLILRTILAASLAAATTHAQGMATATARTPSRPPSAKKQSGSLLYQYLNKDDVIAQSTHRVGPDHSNSRSHSFSKFRIGATAASGTRAASQDLRSNGSNALYGHRHEMRVYGSATGSLFGASFPLFDAEARGVSEVFKTGPYNNTSSATLRLEAGSFTLVNKHSTSRADYTYSLPVWVIFRVPTIEMPVMGIGVDVGANVSLDIGLTMFAEASKAGNGSARLGGSIGPFGNAYAYAGVSAVLYRARVEGQVKILDCGIEASMTAANRSVTGTVDLVIKALSALVKLKLDLNVPTEVRFRVRTWKLWEWRVKIVWRWNQIASLDLINYAVGQKRFNLLTF